MKIAELHEKLIRAARANPPADTVPYAFEQRILTHLALRSATTDGWALWAGALWRAATPCIAVMALMGICTFVLGNGNGSTEFFGTDLENTVMAALNPWGDN